MRNREVSSAEDRKGPELMNVEVDQERYEQLFAWTALWKEGSPEAIRGVLT